MPQSSLNGVCVVHMMATMLMSYVSDLSFKDCGVAAKALTSRFDFLKDDGEVSYVNLFIAFWEMVYLLPLQECQQGAKEELPGKVVSKGVSLSRSNCAL